MILKAKEIDGLVMILILTKKLYKNMKVMIQKEKGIKLKIGSKKICQMKKIMIKLKMIMIYNLIMIQRQKLVSQT